MLQAGGPDDTPLVLIDYQCSTISCALRLKFSCQSPSRAKKSISSSAGVINVSFCLAVAKPVLCASRERGSGQDEGRSHSKSTGIGSLECILNHDTDSK